MRILPGLALAAAVVAGATGATAAFRAVAPPQSLSSSGGVVAADTRQPAATPAPTPAPITRVRYRRCPPHTQLEHRTCVRHVTRVVIEQVATLPAPTTAPAATSALRTPRRAHHRGQASASHDARGQGGSGGASDD